MFKFIINYSVVLLVNVVVRPIEYLIVEQLFYHKDRREPQKKTQSP